MWTPLPEEAAYYSTPAPSDTQSVISQLLVPLTGPGEDATFGRAALPRAPDELKIRAEYASRDGRISIDGDKGKEFVSYQVWEPKAGAPLKGSDLLFIHGINDFGGKFACHARLFLDAGYRVIVPDLPSHGRSTGIHVYLPDLDVLADAVYGVLGDVIKHDSTAADPGQKRKIFVAGQSLGGFVAAQTCLKYGIPKGTGLVGEAEISGGLFLCPMLAISKETRPHWTVELVARGIASFAGPLPLAAANKGKNSEDPTVEEQFNLDPQTYRKCYGKLRVGTGLAILKSLTELNSMLPTLKIPFSLHHGTGDLVTSYHGSEKLFSEASSTDKKIHLYDNYYHIRGPNILTTEVFSL
ncbi:hypothetical protein RQP46_001562 [Phenoliferia psychrophenolica]